MWRYYLFSFGLPKPTHCLRGVAIVPTQKQSGRNTEYLIFVVFFGVRIVKLEDIQYLSTKRWLWAVTNSSPCNTSHRAGTRAPLCRGEQADSARACSYLARKPAGECVTELHALWDVFTEVWAAAGLY